MTDRRTSPHHSTPPDPASWWRRLGWVTDRIAVSGDLPHDRDQARRQLDEWRAAGVTHIVDVRGEWNDASFVAAEAPELTYHWLGTHDHGGGQPDDWFAAGVEAVRAALADPEAKVVIHCHMGVNRAPSLAVAVLVALGWQPIDALLAVRAARPIAAALYSEDATEWALRAAGVSETEVMAQRRAVREWLRANPVDVTWIISRIRLAERSA
jgi:dual specificity phosphatase 3